MTLASWSASRRDQLDAYMHGLFTDAWPSSFAEPCRYPLFGGGKRIRPLLVFAAYEAVTHSDPAPSLPAAAAVELIHTYSLVHDDLPCMDDDDMRRGRPTVHRAFDEPAAVLAGDALLTEAFRILATAPLSAETRIALVAELSTAAGYLGMVGGQAADIALGSSITDVAVLERLHRGKTGALIQASVRMGAKVAGANAEVFEQLSVYGEHVGLAFQLADDVLDADEAEEDDGPPSYVRLLGIDATREKARALSAEAVQIAEKLDNRILVDLARLIADRDV